MGQVILDRLTFIDSANPEEIREIAQWGCVKGITTNPKIMLNANKSQSREELLDSILNVADEFSIPHVSVELTASRDFKALVKEAEMLNDLSDLTVIKVPMFTDGLGLRLISELYDRSIVTNATCLMSFNQAMLAAQSGADYVSLFYRRICDYHKVVDTAQQIVSDVRNYIDEMNHVCIDDITQLICGSIRSVKDVEDCMIAGAHIVTVPYKIFKELPNHIKTDEAIKEFDDSWVEFQRNIKTP